MSRRLSVNVADCSIKDNTAKAMATVARDAAYWLPQVKPEHFTWLTPDDQKKVTLVKTLEELWALDTVYQDYIIAAWW